MLLANQAGDHEEEEERGRGRGARDDMPRELESNQLPMIGRLGAEVGCVFAALAASVKAGDARFARSGPETSESVTVAHVRLPSVAANE